MNSRNNFKKYLSIGLTFYFSIIIQYAFSQVEPCNTKKRTYNVKPGGFRPIVDTLGDLIVSSNGHEVIVKSITNIYYSNKSLNQIKLFMEGVSSFCYLNDSTFSFIPNAPEIKFKYVMNNDTIMKVAKVGFLPEPKIIPFLDNRIPREEKVLMKSWSIDTLSFELEPEYFYKCFVAEDFGFTITDLNIIIIRNGKPIQRKSYADGIRFYIGDLMKNANIGDRLIVQYLPMWLREKNKFPMTCSVLLNYRFGKMK
ncbi:MAG: hypothetical protein K2Q22_08765 [Cytophagales bacterium]|nr:hypothetical protein [Cytophagales bacterium]